MFHFIYLTDHSSLHLYPSVWFSPSFPHLSLSSPTLLSHSHLSPSFIALNLAAYLISLPIQPFAFLLLFFYLFQSIYMYSYTFLHSYFSHLPFSIIFSSCYIFAHIGLSPSVIPQPTLPILTVISLHPPLFICLFFNFFLTFLILLSLSLFLCPLQLVLFGKSSGVRWCHVWKTKAVTC